jgi:probable addiction module antidote protein
VLKGGRQISGQWENVPSALEDSLAEKYLDNDAVIAEYLSAAAEDPNPEVFVAALGDVAKARGIAQIAKDAGLGRESLYKTLSAGAHPRFETINSVLHALGVKFAVVAERES